MARNHASANALRNHVPASRARITNRRPTMRAPDLGWAARFLGSFLALAESRFDGESTLSPQAGNANRWAAKLKDAYYER